MSHCVTEAAAAKTADEFNPDELAQLLAGPVETPAKSAAACIHGIRIGRLVGFAEEGAVALITYPGQPAAAALPARALIDLHAAHFDRDLALMFEDADPNRPVVVGCLRDTGTNARQHPDPGGQVEVDADGQRLVVTAKDQIVLRCGKASITLTKEGKLILQGAYVTTQSSGVLRIQGGSVQIN
jgi:hypothetical protein